MNHEPTEANKELLAIKEKICASDPYALQWLEQCRDTMMVIDHIYDKDEFSPEDVVRVLKHITVDWGINPFYRKNCVVLSVVILNAISSWEFSNIEGFPKFKAYDILTELATSVAFILGGHDMVNKHIPRFRELAYILYAEDEDRDGGKR